MRNKYIAQSIEEFSNVYKIKEESVKLFGEDNTEMNEGQN